MVEEIIYRHAIEKPCEERSAFIQAVCAGVTDLCESVEALIAAHDEGSTPDPCEASTW